MMDINESTATEDLWTPYKELVAVVESYLAKEGGGAPYAVHTFEAVLRRHKQTFLSLFKFPTKNPTSRDEIKRGITEGVTLPSIGRTLLSKELVDEACIISDMYNVNEYLALELLHTAQRQTPRFPGLPRGLVAVLLLYDGRKALVQALKELVMAQEGISWTIPIREELTRYITRYVDQLTSDGLINNTLDTLRKFSLPVEVELLQNNRALPPRKHHNKLVNCIEDTRKLLAGVVFSASAQRGLSRDIVLRILTEETKSPSLGPTGALDEVSLALQMALLYALDLSVLHRREDGEELAKKLPLIQDPDMISALVDELTPPNQEQTVQDNQNATSGVRALCQLSLGLSLSALKRAPQTLLRSTQDRNDLLDQDEALVDAAIDGKVFEYLDEAILSTDFVVKEEYYQRRVHSLITDFIVLMHSKLMEMRVKAEETERAMSAYTSNGISPPNSRCGLSALLSSVARLYRVDPHRLRDEYWLVVDSNHSTPRAGSGSSSSCGSARAASLYKFVRLSGSLSSGRLVWRYLSALCSVAVSRHTWALLRHEPTAAPHLTAHHLLTALTRYRANLRSDPAPFSDHLHSSSMGGSAVLAHTTRPGRLLVRQEEVEGMIAALQLIAAVAREDQAACLAICENLQWDAVNVMFGLICCSIPIELKAELLRCLAALGGSSVTAGRVWAGLEASQIVSITKEKRGLHAELHDIESRMEEYPLSMAFLELLTSLCTAAPLPRALGSGTRPPGLDPYVNHVLHYLLLPAPHRVYKEPMDKWKMLSLCTRLLSIWLESYTPSPSEFPNRNGESNPSPGMQVALQLHAKSDLLRLLFNVMDQATQIMDQNQEYVISTLSNILELLERALSIERALTLAATEAGRPTLIIGLSRLILGTDSSGGSEPLVVAMVAVGCNVAGVRSRATLLISRALHAPLAPSHLLSAVTSEQATAQLLRHAFVECLEAEEWGEDSSECRRSKEAVVALMQQILPAPAPNLAHFLLGYQLTEDISRSSLNEPGVAGFPRTCLHSILDILEKHVTPTHQQDREATDLIEGCYRLLYWLCARNNTSTPVLRFLRARDYFLARHVKAIVNLETASVCTISSRSWLVRTCGCEVGAAAATRQHAALSTILAALTHHTADPAEEWEWCVVRRLISGVAVSVPPGVEPRWELFHQHQLTQAIASCDLPTGIGGKRISVPRLNALLSRELASLQATAPQRNLVALEIQKVLDYVTEVNRQRNLAATLTHYYDSWRQLTELVFCVTPHTLLSPDARNNLILNILQDLLNKISPAEVLPQIGNLASGTVLLLLVNLRHTYILQKRDTSLNNSEFETTFFGPSNQVMQTKSLTLKFILHKILSWILISSGSTQKMRVNLYGALLNFLNIVNLKSSPVEEEDDGGHYVSRLDSSKVKSDKEGSALKSMVIDVISSFGDNLCTIVCSDCISGGHDVCRMVALSCLETLLLIHPHSGWSHTLAHDGYLATLLDTLQHLDGELMEALEPSPKSLRALYIYESKMALLNKIASTRVGAETVLSQGALTYLSNLKCLDTHPDIHTGRGEDDGQFMPSVGYRFRQLLIPALALCNTLLTTLGTENHSCVTHVMHFITSHLECVDVVLRAGHPGSSRGVLEELEGVVGVIGRCQGGGDGAHPRIHSLLLPLIHRFSQQPAEPDVLYYKIVCNLLTYARHSSVSSLISEKWLCAALVSLLQGGVRRCLTHDKLLATTTHQLLNLSTCTMEDMKKLVGESVSSRAALGRSLSGRARGHRRERTLCTYTVDLALYLLWTLLRDTLADHHHTPAITSGKTTGGPMGDELPEMRKTVIAVFNDRFTEELLETAKNQSQAHRNFLELMVKDIKNTLQFSQI